MRNQSLINAKSKQYIFLGYAHENFAYRLLNQIYKKVIRSRDIVFLNRTIENFEKIEKPKSIAKNYVDLGLVLSIIVNADNRRDIQEDDDNIVDEPIPNINVPNEYAEQAPQESLIEHYLKRSTRDHQSFQRYFSHEYVMIIDGKDSKCYQKTMNREQKRE